MKNNEFLRSYGNTIMTSEKSFENKIKKFLKDNNCYFIKQWGGGQFTKSGVPDILASVNGYFVAIEVKAPTGKPSALQLYNLEQIRKSGGVALLLYPKDFDEFKKLILTLKEQPSERWEMG